VSHLQLLIFTYPLSELSFLLTHCTHFQHDFTDLISNVCVPVVLAAQDGGSESACASLKNILSP